MEQLKTLWRQLNHAEKQELADALNTSIAYLSQLAYGYRKPGKHLRRFIELEIDRQAHLIKRKSDESSADRPSAA